MRTEEFESVKITSRTTLRILLAQRKLYDLAGAAKQAGLCVRYLRQLCHTRKIDHHRLLGRYYMTPVEVAALLQPIKAKA